MNKADAAAVAAQDQLEANARDLGAAAMQPVDVDGPPIPCGCGDCTKDAAWVLTVDAGTPGAYRMAGCGDHAGAMQASFAVVPSQTTTGGSDDS